MAKRAVWCCSPRCWIPQKESSSIVGEDGQLYISGMPEKGALQVNWGKRPAQQCRVAFTLPEQQDNTGVVANAARRYRKETIALKKLMMFAGLGGRCCFLAVRWRQRIGCTPDGGLMFFGHAEQKPSLIRPRMPSGMVFRDFLVVDLGITMLFVNVTRGTATASTYYVLLPLAPATAKA